jgi:hypothetical protein
LTRPDRYFSLEHFLILRMRRNTSRRQFGKC